MRSTVNRLIHHSSSAVIQFGILSLFKTNRTHITRRLSTLSMAIWAVQIGFDVQAMGGKCLPSERRFIFLLLLNDLRLCANPFNQYHNVTKRNEPRRRVKWINHMRCFDYKENCPHTLVHSHICTLFSISTVPHQNSTCWKNRIECAFLSLHHTNTCASRRGRHENAEREKRKLIKRVIHKCMQYLFYIFLSRWRRRRRKKVFGFVLSSSYLCLMHAQNKYILFGRSFVFFAFIVCARDEANRFKWISSLQPR